VNKHSQTVETTCKSLEEDLVLYYYQEVSEADKRLLDNHLGACADCRKFLGDLHRLLPQMKTVNELPELFWDNYHREMVQKLTAQEESRHRLRDLFARLQFWMLPAFGTAAVAALALGLVFTKTGTNFVAKKPRAALPIEIISDTNQLEFFKSMDLLESLDNLEGSDDTYNGAKPI
jgi:predicted anti-sigma-YlaC factor YlaD